MKLEEKELLKRALCAHLPFDLPIEVNNRNQPSYRTTLMPSFIADFSNVVPIFRKWSDLTNEIEVNGEKFAPEKRLKKIYHKINRLAPQQFYELVQHALKGLANNRCKDKNRLGIQWELENPKDLCNNLPFYVIQKLIEWGFNVFNIPDHLCIYE